MKLEERAEQVAARLARYAGATKKTDPEMWRIRQNFTRGLMIFGAVALVVIMGARIHLQQVALVQQAIGLQKQVTGEGFEGTRLVIQIPQTTLNATRVEVQRAWISGTIVHFAPSHPNMTEIDLIDQRRIYERIPLVTPSPKPKSVTR